MTQQIRSRATALTHDRWTAGERQTAFAYIVCGLVGAALAFLIALRVGRSSFIERGPDMYDLWILAAGFAGCMLALRYVSRRFGHGGLQGLRQALFGMALMTLVAPIVIGTLILPLYGTMFGPFVLAVTFAGSPFVAVVWFATLCGVHVLFTTLRQERDTIFAAGAPA